MSSSSPFPVAGSEEEPERCTPDEGIELGDRRSRRLRTWCSNARSRRSKASGIDGGAGEDPDVAAAGAVDGGSDGVLTTMMSDILGPAKAESDE